MKIWKLYLIDLCIFLTCLSWLISISNWWIGTIATLFAFVWYYKYFLSKVRIGN